MALRARNVSVAFDKPGPRVSSTYPNEEQVKAS